MFCLIKNEDWTLVVPANKFYLSKGLYQIKDYQELDNFIRGSIDVSQHMRSGADIWRGHESYSVICNQIKKIKPDIVVDIGAFAGIFSIISSQLVPSARIISFEPNPSNCFCSAINFRLNKCPASLYPFAVSSDLGQASFDVPENMSISGKLISDPSRTSVTVPVVTFDSLVNLDSFSSAVIKIDVEGLEPEVIKGMSNSLLHHSSCIAAMIIEYHPPSWQSPDNRNLLNELLKMFSFKCYHSAWQFLSREPREFMSAEGLNEQLKENNMQYCDIILTRFPFSA